MDQHYHEEVKKVPKKKIRKVDPKSPFAHVDELARPLHRGAGPSGVQKKKLSSEIIKIILCCCLNYEIYFLW